MKDTAPVRKQKLYEEVVRSLQAAIVSGEYRPGDFLPSEREIGESFGVGRTSIREALLALQRMGLITVSNGERARVSIATPGSMVGELSGIAQHFLVQPKGVQYFQQARLLLEVGLAELAAISAKAPDINRLGRLLRANGDALESNLRFRETDVAFHLGIAEVARNPIFNALHLAVAEWLVEQRDTSIAANGSAHAAFAAHQRIFEAIARRDGKGAADEMRLHLEEVESFYWRAEGKVAASPRQQPRVSL